MLTRDVLSLARMISLVERESEEVPSIMKQICLNPGNAYAVGITGPPGAGKSVTVDQLTSAIRKRGSTVGIICADPSSPFTGGALLGDRIRMQRHCLDDGVFIRSMATRGSHGGLPRNTRDVAKLLSACGKNYVLVETVGVGQTELDIMENADTIVVVLTPEAGDTIQTMKAGLLEIADIFTVNKADRPGADNLMQELKNMLRLRPGQMRWQVPVLATQACNNVGIDDLLSLIDRHRQVLEESGQLEQRRKRQRRQEFIEAVEARIRGEIMKLMQQDGELSRQMERVENGGLDPRSAAEEVVESVTLGSSLSKAFQGKKAQ